MEENRWEQAKEAGRQAARGTIRGNVIDTARELEEEFGED